MVESVLGGVARLVERALPLREVNVCSEVEAAFRTARGRFKQEFKEVFGFEPEALSKGLPQPHNIHTWFARRPTSPARVLTLASVVTTGIDLGEFREALGLGFQLHLLNRRRIPPVIYMAKPNRDKVAKLVQESISRKPSEIVVVDPMAGGGSIPLESLRLGFRTIAIEYNPVAYLILKATVEFPAKYADAGLFEETLRAAKELVSRAREELDKYYGEDAMNYIFARGIKCPYCGGLIPLQGVAPQIANRGSFRRKYLRLVFDKDRKTFTAETTDAKVESPYARSRSTVTCPYCDRVFKLRGGRAGGDTPFNRWFSEHAKLMRSVVGEFGKVKPEMEEELLKLHIPLVKQVDNDFVAIWGDEDEKKRFVQAFRDLSRDVLDLWDYIPVDEIPRENAWAAPARNRGLTHWYMLFNPRQLLALAKLTKFVAETADKLASKNGEFGAAVALYLAFAIDKIADYNTIATHWHTSRVLIGHTMRGDSIDFRNEYSEIKRIDLALEWALEIEVAESGKYTKTAGGILPVLRFLCEEFRGAGLGDRVSVYLADATRLSELLGVGSVDVVNVDPPYFEQVIYSDRSEFFWVVLRRALRPVLELLFKPGLRLSGWSWDSPVVPREREVVTRDREDSSGRFRRFFSEFVRETYRVLRDDGVLVLWFTHPTDIAWRSVGEALYSAGYVVSKVWPVKTEMKTRLKRLIRGMAQETSLVIVARKYTRYRIAEVGGDIRRALLSHQGFVKAVEEVVEDVRKVAREAGASPADLMTLILGSALAVASRFEVFGAKFDQLFDAAATKVVEVFVAPLLRRVLVESGPAKLAEDEARVVIDYVRRAMLRDAATRSYLTLWLLSRVDLESGVRRNEPLPLSYDFAQTIAKLLGYDVDRLKKLGLIYESVIGGGEDDEEEGESKKSGKALFVAVLKALTATGAKVPWQSISQTVPGRAIYLAYLALNESGAPSVRASSIRGKLVWSGDEISEAASLAIVLLETARDEDLGISKTSLDQYLVGSSEDGVARELAVRALLRLVRGEK